MNMTWRRARQARHRMFDRCAKTAALDTHIIRPYQKESNRQINRIFINILCVLSKSKHRRGERKKAGEKEGKKETPEGVSFFVINFNICSSGKEEKASKSAWGSARDILCSPFYAWGEHERASARRRCARAQPPEGRLLARRRGYAPLVLNKNAKKKRPKAFLF